MNTNPPSQVVEITSTQITPAAVDSTKAAQNIVPDSIRLTAMDAKDPREIEEFRRKLHFVRRRAEGATYAVIAAELGVSPSTLVYWSREYREDIQNLRTMRMEALQYEMLSEPELRVRRMAKLLAEIETELGNRKISDLPTSRLFSMADTLRRRILQETGSVKFTGANDMLTANETRQDLVWKA